MRAARTTWFWRLLAFYCAVTVAELSLVWMPNVLAVIVAVFTIEAIVLLRLTLSVTVALRTRVTLAAAAWPESSGPFPLASSYTWPAMLLFVADVARKGRPIDGTPF